MKWWQGLMVGMVLVWVWILVQMPDGRLHVIFCDVGQGDAVLVVKNDFQMVIDGGPDGGRLLSCLGDHLPFWDRRVEVVVNTHPQRDHLGGLDELLERYSVSRLLINGAFGGGDDAKRLRKLVVERGVELVLPKKNDVLRIGSLQFDILWPEERVGSEMAWAGDNMRGSELHILGESVDENINKISVVGVLRYGGFKLLLVGDIGFDEEKKLLGDERLINVDVLKVAHHGSKYSSSLRFLEKVRPKVAVVQVGRNRFGHPTSEALGRLSKVGAKVFRTDLDGEVEVVSDGERYWVRD